MDTATSDEDPGVVEQPGNRNAQRSQAQPQRAQIGQQPSEEQTRSRADGMKPNPQSKPRTETVADDTAAEGDREETDVAESGDESSIPALEMPVLMRDQDTQTPPSMETATTLNERVKQMPREQAQSSEDERKVREAPSKGRQQSRAMNSQQ